MNLIMHTLVSTRISLASISEENRSKAGIVDKCEYVTNGRERDQRYINNLHGWAISQILPLDSFE